MSVQARSVAAVVWRDWRVEHSYRLPWVMDVITLLSFTSAYYYIGRFTGARVPGESTGFFTYVLPGLAVLRLHFGLTRIISSLDREQSTGTLELVLSAPAPSWLIVFGCGLYEMARSLAFALLGLAIGRWLFGAGLTLGPRSWTALGLGLAGATMFYLALVGVIAGVLIVAKQGMALAHLTSAAFPLIAGIYFSPAVLPHPLREVTAHFPLTLAVDLVRGGVVNAVIPWREALTMLGETTLCLPLGAAAVAAAVARAKRRGALGQY